MDLIELKDKAIWARFLQKKKILMDYGLKRGLVRPYSKEFIESLRNTYFGGIPLSIILLDIEFCNGRCYDRGWFPAFGFGDDDYRVVHADIDSIRLRPDLKQEYRKFEQEGSVNQNYGNHCYIERVKSDGTTWVYDTSVGLVIEKGLYDKIERPKPTKICSRQETEDYIEYHEIKEATFERDKYVVPFLLFSFIERSKHRKKQEVYDKVLLEEIEEFKRRIEYEKLCAEIDQERQSNGFPAMQFK